MLRLVTYLLRNQINIKTKDYGKSVIKRQKAC